MITRLGDVYQSNIGPNSSLWDIISHPIDAITYTGEAISSTISGMTEPEMKGTLPSPIVASQGSPKNIYEGTIAGAYTPEMAAAEGLDKEKQANSEMLYNYENTLNNISIPWGTIGLVVGIGVLTILVVKK